MAALIHDLPNEILSEIFHHYTKMHFTSNPDDKSSGLVFTQTRPVEHFFTIPLDPYTPVAYGTLASLAPGEPVVSNDFLRKRYDPRCPLSAIQIWTPALEQLSLFYMGDDSTLADSWSEDAVLDSFELASKLTSIKTTEMKEME
ncbi:hypothetical protein HHX47_DHR2000341 [Lentinula edodes]|nr:hypothetical protein HHX47_DHR2000341 [Lentinula edodes]